MVEPTARFEKGSFCLISCTDLQTDPNPPSKYSDPEAQKDLENSHKKKGILQPILFRVDEDSDLIIVAGELRLKAAREAGLEFIPAIYVERNYFEIALIEKLLRADLTPIALAENLDRAMREYGYKQEQLAEIICKAKLTVSEILPIALPEKIKLRKKIDKKSLKQG